MMRDAHLGDALATFTYVDPAIQNNACEPRNPALDMFSAVNGYDVERDAATYTKGFSRRYTTAQARRNQHLINEALNLFRKTTRVPVIRLIQAMIFHLKSWALLMRGYGSLTSPC